MSLIHELRAAEAAFEASKKRLEDLKNDPALLNVQAFEQKLRDLMGEHGMSLKDVNALIDPDYREPTTTKPPRTLKRVMRVFTNPHTGEKVESAGGHNQVLKEWREQYGADVVKDWGVPK